MPVLAFAVLFAAWQVWEARRLRRAQAQPFVVVDFEVVRGNEVHIVISNIGATMARDVRLSFDPQLSSSLDSRDVVPPRELKPLSECIPSLPPGKRIDVLFDIFHERDETTFTRSKSASMRPR